MEFKLDSSCCECLHWPADEGENTAHFDCMLQNLYTIISSVHIIALHICALICTEGCLSGYVSFHRPPAPEEILIACFISIFIEKKNVIFCFPSNCQFCGMNWQLCTPIFLAALLESLLNKLGENSETWSVWASFTWRSEPSKRPPLPLCLWAVFTPLLADRISSEMRSHHCSQTGFLLRRDARHSHLKAIRFTSLLPSSSTFLVSFLSNI